MSQLEKFSPNALSLLRIFAGLLFLEHGLNKAIGFPAPMGMDHLPPMMIAAAAIEIVGGALIVLGLYTRYAAFIASGEMAVAYFSFHVPMGGFWPSQNHGAEAILYCFVFLYIAAAGAGAWSLDAMRAKST